MKDCCLRQSDVSPLRASRVLETLPPESVWKEVEKILASPLFARSVRLHRFVRFSIHLTLEGRAEELKESLLGVHVFDRGPTFDPTNDSIVRVEAHRLRSKLSEYYKRAGRSDELLIEYPVGCYVPIIRERARRWATN
jgi:hypothetical protein